MVKRQNATTDLTARVAQLEALLAQMGVTLPTGPVDDTERPDYIGFGTPKHQAFLGLETVEDVPAAKADGYTVLKGRETDQNYRLVDEMGAVQMMRPIDPDKAVLLVLRQKINTFEAGTPEPPEGAPAIFRPPGMRLILPNL